MDKVFIILYPIIGLIINILKVFITPFVLPFRKKARLVVYNHMIKTGMISLIGIKKYKVVTRLEPINKDVYFWYNTNKGSENKFFIKDKVITKFEFYLYFYLVWIWLDDYNHDIISLKVLLRENIDSAILTGIKKEVYDSICSSFDTPTVLVDSKKYWVLGFISLFYSSNNFINYSKYRKYNTITFFNNVIGWQKEYIVKGTNIRNYKEYEIKRLS